MDFRYVTTKPVLSVGQDQKFVQIFDMLGTVDMIVTGGLIKFEGLKIVLGLHLIFVFNNIR